jgi:hypothetical protein
MRFKSLETPDGEHYAVGFTCPGCGMSHHLPNQNTAAGIVAPRWTFNGNFDRPTLTPSILSRGAIPPGDDEGWDDKAICHSFVTDGRIQFLGDCTHALAGQTVDLPEIEP